jgi:hypothetical protein
MATKTTPGRRGKDFTLSQFPCFAPVEIGPAVVVGRSWKAPGEWSSEERGASSEERVRSGRLSARDRGGTPRLGVSARELRACVAATGPVLRRARKMGQFGIDRHPRPKNSARCVAPRVRNTRQTQRLAWRGTTKGGVFSRPRKKEKKFALANGRSQCSRAHNNAPQPPAPSAISLKYEATETLARPSPATKPGTRENRGNGVESRPSIDPAPFSRLSPVP